MAATTVRAAGTLVSAVISVAVVLLVATPALHLPIDVLHIGWPLLLVACVCGVVATLSLGVTVVVLLLGARDSHGHGEIIAQTLYIVSGAILPIAVLPGPLAAPCSAPMRLGCSPSSATGRCCSGCCSPPR